MFDPHLSHGNLAHQKNNSLQIIEIFASVQGETSFAGLPTTFIRLAGCNLRCSWCDTTYSFGRGNIFSYESIFQKVSDFGLKYICITGGEPLLQKNVYGLMSQLSDKGHILTLETSGSLNIDEVDPRVHVILDVKCPGSNMDHKNCLQNLSLLKEKDEVKFVIKDREDYDFAKNICHQYRLFNRHNEILFSPVFEELESKQLVAWIVEDKLPVRLNLQVHKFIWEPQTQGV